MGTEVRIGIATGLLIVVVAGVYFFYGSNRDAEDLRIVTGPLPAPAPTIPADRQQKPAAASTPRASKPAPAAARPTPRPITAAPNNSTGTALTGATAARQPQPAPTHVAAQPRPIAPANSPVRPAPTTTSPPMLANASPAGQSHPPAPQPTRSAPPSPTGVNPNAGSAQPANTPVSPPTVLRSAPSSALVEATKRNLEGESEKPSGSVAPAGSITLPSSLEPAGPKPAAQSNTLAAAHNAPAPVRSTPVSTVATPRSQPSVTAPGAQPSTRTDEPLIASAARPMQTPPPPTTWPRQHVIEPGDTLSVISSKYYDSTQFVPQIMKANPSLNPRRLKIGDIVTIPAPEAGAVKLANADSRRRAADATPTVIPIAARPMATSSGVRTYTVQTGDTLYNIARRTLGDERKWKQLFEKNRATLKNDPKRLKIGMVLTLP